MADFNKYFPILMEKEGGYINDPIDPGGATKFGITFAVWLKNGYDKDGDGDIDIEDLKKITQADAFPIAKKKYWDKVAGDEVYSQSVAEILFDWAYNSGYITAVQHVQNIIGTKADGEIGPKTIAAINAYNSKTLFDRIKVERIKFYENIVKHKPSQKKYLNGWRNRVLSFQFKN